MSAPGVKPNRYTPELADEICRTIAATTKTNEVLCNELKHWPASCNLYEWINHYPDFKRKYRKAKRQQAETAIEEIEDLINDASQDFYDDKNGKHVNTAYIKRLQMKVSYRQWKIGKLLPKRWGNKEKNVTLSVDNGTQQKLQASAESIDANNKKYGY